MTVAAARRTRRSRVVDVPLPERLLWTVPDLAAMCGISHPTLYARLTEDPGGQRAVIHMPGGVDVRAHRDHANGHWRIYRAQWELAVARASEPATADLLRINPTT